MLFGQKGKIGSRLMPSEALAILAPRFAAPKKAIERLKRTPKPGVNLPTKPTQDTGLVERGNRIRGLMLNKSDNKGANFSPSAVRGYVSSNTDKWEEKKYTQYKVHLRGDNGRWVSTKWSDIGELPFLDKLISNEEQYYAVLSAISDVVIYLKEGGHMGDDGENNDCLWDCLVTAVPIPGRLPWKNAEEFKESLGLERDDKVPLKMIRTVEKQSNVSIYVFGTKHPEEELDKDKGWYIIRESKHNSTRGISIDLHYDPEEEHCSLVPFDSLHRMRGKLMPHAHKWYGEGVRLSQPKKGAFFFTYPNTEEGETRVVQRSLKNGEIITKLWSREYFRALKESQEGQRDWVMHSVGNVTKGKKTTPEAIEEEIRYWLDARREILSATRESSLFKEAVDIRMYKSFKQAAVNIWRRENLQFNPDVIDEEEAKWIEEAKLGGLQYSITNVTGKPYIGEAVQYDFNSKYPHIMSQPDFLVPLMKPKFRTYTKNFFKPPENPDDYLAFIGSLPYGIFRCDITEESHFWKPKPSGHYTTYSIIGAIQKGIKVQMTMDGKPNAMVYKRGLVSGEVMFKPYMDKFYSLKKDKVIGAKNMLNQLWGGLVEKERKTLISDGKGNRVSVGEGWKIEDIILIDFEKNHYKVILEKTRDAYYTPFARLKPFLLSYGQLSMEELLFRYADDVLRVHTDGFAMKKHPGEDPLEKFTMEKDGACIGVEMGQLKIEHDGIITLTNVNDYEWSDGHQSGHTINRLKREAEKKNKK